MLMEAVWNHYAFHYLYEWSNSLINLLKYKDVEEKSLLVISNHIIHGAVWELPALIPKWYCYKCFTTLIVIKETLNLSVFMY
jgi:hypothetical protein